MKEIDKNLPRYFLLFFLCCQVGLIIYLCQIIIKKQNTLGVSINIFERNSNRQTSKESNLKYFYEPVRNSIEYPPRDVSWFKDDMGIKINSDSLNDEEIDTTSSSRINIVTLGDSFTYGQFVKSKDNWVSVFDSLVRDRISKKLQTINLGVKGYDIEYSVERYRIRGQKYNPKLVIWFLKGDDFNSVAEILTPIIQEEETKLTSFKNPDDKYIPPKGINKDIEKMMNKFGGSEKELLEYQKQKILGLRSYYKGMILIIHLDLSQKHIDALSSLAKQDNRIRLLGLPNIYDDKKNYFPDLHPTEIGYKEIAQVVGNYVINNDILQGIK